MLLTCPGVWAMDVTINLAKEYQTIEGFGFFGLKSVWWGGDFYDDAWGAAAIDNMGMTMWRDEYYSEEPNQDANWAKQQGPVSQLYSKAKASGVDLRVILSVWSPPSRWKTNGILKGGGHLKPENYADFGNWLVEGIKKREDAGIKVYGISPQNECEYVETYNSCVYSVEQYRAMLGVAGPIVHKAYPNVKIFGCERMLTDSRTYEGQVAADPSCKPHFNVLAVHGYSNGVDPVSGGASGIQRWKGVGGVAGNMKIPAWMTETSGMGDPDLRYLIHSALYYGHLSAWVQWYGCTEFISGNSLSAKGTSMKHWARWVRPGAVMVDVSEPSAPSVLITAFKHAANKTVTVVIANAGSATAQIALKGAGLPGSFKVFGDNCQEQGTTDPSNISVPGGQMFTLYAENVALGVQEREPTHLSASVTPRYEPRRFSISGRALSAQHSQAAARGLYCRVMADKSGQTRYGTVRLSAR